MYSPEQIESTVVPDLEKILELDPYLNPHKYEIKRRYRCFEDYSKWIESLGGIDDFTKSYQSYGCHVDEDGTVRWKEWAPAAQEMYLKGDFSNEFGHPEWLDFPRSGNNKSCHYARRQWNLVDDKSLKYKFLNNWDKAMNDLEDKYHWLSAPQAFVSRKHEDDKVIAFERAGVLFVFNFHPNKSYPDYKIGVETPGRYMTVLDSDHPLFGGLNRIDPTTEYFTRGEPWDNRNNSIFLYVPARTCIVLVWK